MMLSGVMIQPRVKWIPTVLFSHLQTQYSTAELEVITGLRQMSLTSNINLIILKH